MSQFASDETPLLHSNHRPSRPKSFAARMLDGIQGLLYRETDQPSWSASGKFFFGRWSNVFLVFVPLSFLADTLDWDAEYQFGFSFFAILPLAVLLADATDQLALHLGHILSNLVNTSFGNAVEIIVGITALMQGQFRIVQTSLLGSILSSLLLILGSSFFAGGLKFSESNFQVTAAQTSSSLMTLSCITLVIPAAYHSSHSRQVGTSPARAGLDVMIDTPATVGLRFISRGTAIMLLGVYLAYLTFQVRTHGHLFVAEQIEDQEEVVEMNSMSAGVALLVTTLLTSFCADNLVAPIQEVAENNNISEEFIGLIILPMVSNAAQHYTSVACAVRNKMERTIGLCVGSAIQISTFVVPLLVIVGWFSHHDLTLFFADFETVVFFASVLLVNFLIQDGKSNYMEGLILIVLYLVIALAFWVS